MAKKKQGYSAENVDEMVEQLKRSYESADRVEGEDADPSADDEAFAKMLVEMFGKHNQDKPSAARNSNEVYSAEDFMPEDEDDQEPVGGDVLDAPPEEDFEEEIEEDFEEEFVEDEPVGGDVLDAPPEEDFEEEIEEEFEEDYKEEYEQQSQQFIADQIRAHAQEQLRQQVVQEQKMQEQPETEPEIVPEDELPWFEDDSFDEEDAREIAEYEALVAEDEQELEEEFDEEYDEEFDQEFDQEFDEQESVGGDVLDAPLDKEDDQEFDQDLEDEIDQEYVMSEEEQEASGTEADNQNKVIFTPLRISDEQYDDDTDLSLDQLPEEEAELEEDFEEEYDEEEPVGGDVLDAPLEQEPEEQEDYVDMLLDSLEEWQQSVKAVKAQMRAEHSADIPAVSKPTAEPEPLPKSKPLQEAASQEVLREDPLTDDAPDYPAQDPMQGRVAQSSIAQLHEVQSGVELDEKDIHMMAVLGYEQQVKDRVGSARVRHASLSQKTKRMGQGTDNPLCFAWRGKEYLDAKDEAEIKQNYKHEKPWVIIRLSICVLVLFSLIALDNAYLLGYLQGSIPAIINTPLYPLLAAVCLAVVAAFSWRRLWEGLRSMFTHRHSLYSVPALLLIASFVYDIILIFLVSGRQYMMFNSLALLALTLCTIADVLYLYDQERNFKVARSGKPRYGIEKMSDTVAHSRLPVKEREQAQAPHAGAYRVRSLGHVGGYFRRTGESAEKGPALSITYSVLLVCAIAAAVVTYIATGQGMDAMTAFMVCINGAMPLAMLLFTAIPTFVAGKTLAQSGCAVIGTGAWDEYRDVKALSFDAGQMFTAYGSSQITVRGDSDIGTYMDKTRTVLRALGGTLADMAGADAEDAAEPAKIEIMSVAENGLTLYMDGITCVMMGDYDYLAARGVRLPRRDMEANYKKRKNSAVIYLAFDGVFRVGYSVDYELRREFLLRAEQLKQHGITPVIMTYDPCINRESVRARIGDKGIFVERQTEYEGAANEITLDCGVIATRAPEDVLLPLLACRKLRRVRILGLVLRFAYLALTAALILLLAALGVIWYAWPLMLLLYQALWLLIIPVACTTLLGDLRKTK